MKIAVLCLLNICKYNLDNLLYIFENHLEEEEYREYCDALATVTLYINKIITKIEKEP